MSCTRFGELWDQSTDDLLVQAVCGAVASAGLRLQDIDAYWLATMLSGTSGQALTRPLKISERPVTRVENKCASGSDALRNAVFAVASGAHDVAMAVGVEKLKDSGHSGLVTQPGARDGTSFHLSGPGAFAMLVPAYEHKYGVSSEHLRDALSHIAWKNHRNGSFNPLAHFRKEVPLETISAAPPIAGRLNIFDCSGVSDGAAAAIVCRAEDAHRYTDTPLYIKAVSLTASPGMGSGDAHYDYTSFPEAVFCARDAYRQAGITDPRAALALVELHDCFTPTELILLEDLGLSERGMAWKDVLHGEFDIDGAVPVNPDGGLKSFGHPIGASGLRMLYEAWLQLRGQAGPRQIETTRTMALTQNLGGGPGDCVCAVTIVGSEPSA
jgi:acetyl-CoA C-acetyltransferase